MKRNLCIIKLSRTFNRAKSCKDLIRDCDLECLKLTFEELDKLNLLNITNLNELINTNPEKLFDGVGGAATFNKINRNLSKFLSQQLYPSIDVSNPIERLDAILNRVSKLDEKTLIGPIPIYSRASIRLSNCLKRCPYQTLSDLINAKAENIIRIRNLGKKSVFELCDLLEELCDGDFGIIENSEFVQSEVKILTVFDELKTMPDSFLDKEIDADPIYVRMLNVFRNANIKTYRHLMELGEEGLMQLPSFGKKTLKTTKTIIKDAILAEKNLGNGSDGQINFVKEIIEKIEQVFNENTDIHLAFSEDYRVLYNYLIELLYNGDFGVTNRMMDIFKRRNNNQKIETLEEVALHYNLTRERIRQIESKTEKLIIAQFSSISHQNSNESIKDFYKKIFEYTDCKLLSCIFFLSSKKDIVSIIVKKCIINKLSPENKEFLLDKKHLESFYSIASKSDKIVNYFSEKDFYNCLNNADGMKEVDEEIINSLDSGIKSSNDINKFFYKIKIRDTNNVRLISFPLIDTLSCDIAIVIENKYVILVNLFKDITELIQPNTLAKYDRFLSYCKENGFGCAWCYGYLTSIFSLRNKQISRKKELEILTMLNERIPASFTEMLRMARTNPEILSAVIIQNNFCYSKKDGFIYRLSDFDLNSIVDDEDQIISNIKSSSFTEVQKIVFLAFLELEKNYIRPKKKNIYFSVLRVFLTGYEYSHLYEQCCNFEYFGSCKDITPSLLRTTLEWLEKLELIVSGITPHGKTYYYSNGKIISKSRILQILLNKTCDIDDFTSLLDDFDIEVD